MAPKKSEATLLKELMEEKCYNALPFEDHDVLECEVTPIAPSTFIGYPSHKIEALMFELPKAEKTVVEIPAKHFKWVLENHVASISDVENLRAVQMDIGRQRKRVADKYRSQGKTEDEVESLMIAFNIQNNAYGEYFKKYQETFKPLMPIKVLNNLGPRVDDLQAKQTEDKKSNDAMLGTLTKILEKLVDDKVKK